MVPAWLDRLAQWSWRILAAFVLVAILVGIFVSDPAGGDADRAGRRSSPRRSRRWSAGSRSAAGRGRGPSRSRSAAGSSPIIGDPPAGGVLARHQVGGVDGRGVHRGGPGRTTRAAASSGSLSGRGRGRRGSTSSATVVSLASALGSVAVVMVLSVLLVVLPAAGRRVDLGRDCSLASRPESPRRCEAAGSRAFDGARRLHDRDGRDLVRRRVRASS